MNNNVFSFREAIEAGYEPRDYDYGKMLPVGNFDVELDFMIWAKGSTPAVTCFCTMCDTGQKIRFNVFRENETGHMYLLKNTTTDVRYLTYGSVIKINIILNKRGNTAVTG